MLHGGHIRHNLLKNHVFPLNGSLQIDDIMPRGKDFRCQVVEISLDLTFFRKKRYNTTLWHDCAIEVITMKRKLILITLVLGFSIFYGAICPQLCPSDQDNLGFILNANCLLFVSILAGFSILSSLLLIGNIPFKNISSTPEEFIPSLFRPPRFLS